MEAGPAPGLASPERASETQPCAVLAATLVNTDVYLRQLLVRREVMTSPRVERWVW